MLFFFSASIAHINYQFEEKKPLPADSSSPWLSWKVVTSLFVLGLASQFLITFMYWGVLYQGWPIGYRDYRAHGIPLGLLLLDWHMNRILVEVRQIVPLCYLTIGYSLFIIVWTFGTGQPVYFILKFDSTGSYILLLILDIANIIVFLILVAYNMFWVWLFYDDAQAILDKSCSNYASD